MSEVIPNEEPQPELPPEPPPTPEQQDEVVNQLAVVTGAIENDDSFYQPTGTAVPIAGYVYHRIAYFFSGTDVYTADSGRLNDPDLIQWQHYVASIRPVRHEYTTAHDQLFETVPITFPN